MAPPSKVWAFFKKKDDRIAVCKKCFKSVKCSGNTSNLHKHLKSHSINAMNTGAKTDPKSDDDPSVSLRIGRKILASLDNPSTSSSSSPAIYNENVDPDEPNKNPSLKEVFQKISSHKEGGTKHNNVTMCLLYFICKDMRPFSVIEGEGFIRLIKEVAPFYKIPSTTCIKNRLTEKYEVMKLVFMERIAKVNEICVTLDVWTETMSEKSFLGVTGHFLENINIVNCTLATRELSESHTSDYLSEVFIDIMNGWEIPVSKIRCVVTDNGANIVAAIKSVVSDKNHLPCFPHTINLVLEAAMKNQTVTIIVAKIHKIVKYFKNSVNNADKLRKTQMQNGIAEGCVKKFILDVKTRWNSTYYMLERFLEMIKFASPILLNDVTSPEMPSGQEIEIIKQLIVLLKPFEQVTKESSGENYVTLSKVIPMINCLLKELNTFTSNNDCINNIRNALLFEIRKRFGNIEYNTHVAIATLLDPRFKNIHFRDTNACGRAISKLKEIIKQDIVSSSDSEQSEGSKPDYDFWRHHRVLMIGQKKRKGKSNSESDQLSNYLSYPLSALQSNPLEEWEDTKYVFPLLYKQARIYLVAVASSVPCERLFSKAGATVTKTRNRLTGKHLEKLLFLGNIPQNQFFD